MTSSPTGLTYLHPAELKESPDNPREIRPDRFEALKHSMRVQPSMMEARPVIADTDGFVVAGNMRQRAAIELLAEEGTTAFKAEFAHRGIPVFVKAFDPAERREWMLRDNQGYGDWVPGEVAQLVKMHESEGGDLELLGFDDQALSDLKKLASDDGGEPGGDAGEDPIPDTYGVVVECESEQDQIDLLEELQERGLNVRALL